MTAGGFRTTNILSKFDFPANPMIGLMMSFTNEPTTVVNAAPMMMPIARSSTLPLAMNSLNSLNMFELCTFGAITRLRAIADVGLLQQLAYRQRSGFCGVNEWTI